MNFPDDVFKNIMSYFHSSYKKPSHYEAILNQDDFYYLRLINMNQKYCMISTTYYIKVFTNSRINSSLKNILRFKNSGVASPKIIDEFKEIIDKYKFIRPYLPRGCATRTPSNVQTWNNSMQSKLSYN